MRDVGALKRLPLFLCEAQVGTIRARSSSSRGYSIKSGLPGIAWWSSVRTRNLGPRTWTGPLGVPSSAPLARRVKNLLQALVGIEGDHPL